MGTRCQELKMRSTGPDAFPLSTQLVRSSNSETLLHHLDGIVIDGMFHHARRTAYIDGQVEASTR